MLRERFAHRYSRTLLGMHPRSRRGETSRHGESSGSGMDGIGRSITSRRSGGAKVVEADGEPLVDTEALHAMIRLFRIVQVLLVFFEKLVQVLLDDRNQGEVLQNEHNSVVYYF